MSRQSCLFLERIQVRENRSVGSLGESRAQVTAQRRVSSTFIERLLCAAVTQWT